jgi:hypothetical protein
MPTSHPTRRRFVAPWRSYYCTISTVGSVTCHRRPWTEHPQYFVAGHSQLWTSFQTRIQYFWCLLGHFEDKTEPILHSVTLIFARELGPIVFTTVTGHTLWTYGRNGTVLVWNTADLGAFLAHSAFFRFYAVARTFGGCVTAGSWYPLFVLPDLGHKGSTSFIEEN